MNQTHPRHTALCSTALLAVAVAITACRDRSHEHDRNHANQGATSAEHDHDHEGHDPPAQADDAHGHAEEHQDEVTLTPEAIARYGVTIGTAEPRVLERTFIAPARVGFNADAMAHVGSPLRGRASEIKVRLGDTVRRGDPLLVVESPELGEAQADYFQKRTAVQTAQPAVELSRVTWERAKGLYEQSQGISLTEVQKREAEHKSAVAAQKAAESSVVGSENRLHLLGMSQVAIEELARTGEIDPKYVVQAPMDGQVVQREVTLGELVSPDREALLVLADTSTVWVLADVTEAHLHEIATGSPARVMLGAAADETARTFEGRVAFIAPLVDASTRTAQVRIEVPSTSLALKPGMFARVEITAAPDPAAPPVPILAVPESAVQTVEGGPAVFVPVENEPNTFARRSITIGSPVNGFVPVLSGLAEREQFVITGSFILKAELGKGAAAHEH